MGVSLSGHLCRRGQTGSLWIPGPAPVPAAWPGPEWAGSAPSPQFQPVVSEALPLWSRLAPPLGRAPRGCLSRVCSCPLGFADLVPGPPVLSDLRIKKTRGMKACIYSWSMSIIILLDCSGLDSGALLVVWSLLLRGWGWYASVLSDNFVLIFPL